MSVMIDKLYVNFLSSRLDRFRWIRDSLAVCRCPFCGDGARGTKTRFYIYENIKYGSTGLNTECKNCGVSSSFHNFLKDFDPGMYKDYRLDNFRDKYGREPRAMFSELQQAQEWAESVTEPKLDSVNLFGAVKLSELPGDHIAVKYVKGRLIPDKYLDYLMYSENFQATTAAFKDAEYAKKIPGDERLIIPFYNEYGELLCYQGRSLDPNCKMRYISIKKTDAATKTFGMDRIDRSKDVRVVEGPIDSFFVLNCLAAADADLIRVPGDVYIYDHQYKNNDVVRHINKAIEGNFKVVLFPESFVWKDLNEAVMDGVTTDQIETLIKENTFQGLKAKLVFSKLRGVNGKNY